MPTPSLSLLPKLDGFVATAKPKEHLYFLPLTLVFLVWRLPILIHAIQIMSIEKGKESRGQEKDLHNTYT